MADKKPKEKNVMKIGWELQFTAENIFVAAMGHYIADKAKEEERINIPTDHEVCKIIESSIRAAILFNENKKRFGIQDRCSDSVNEEE